MKKRRIYQIMGITFWALLAGGVLALLISGVDARDQQPCREVRIVVSGGDGPLFMHEKEIEQVVSQLQGQLVGTPISAFRVGEIEDSLQHIPWIADADLYFDNLGKMEVRVVERDPVARVFTQFGQSFYLDKDLICMPLHKGYVARIPVFTGFTGNVNYLNGEDSLVLDQIRALGEYILADSFWMAQVEQVNYNEDGSFTIVPKVGNHLVQLGKAEQMERKFRNLYIFYRDVLSKAGPGFYESIHLGYNGQVVATRRGAGVLATTADNNTSENQQTDSLKADKTATDKDISKRKNKQP